MRTIEAHMLKGGDHLVVGRAELEVFDACPAPGDRVLVRVLVDGQVESMLLRSGLVMIR